MPPKPASRAVELTRRADQPAARAPFASREELNEYMGRRRDEGLACRLEGCWTGQPLTSPLLLVTCHYCQIPLPASEYGDIVPLPSYNHGCPMYHYYHPGCREAEWRAMCAAKPGTRPAPENWIVAENRMAARALHALHHPSHSRRPPELDLDRPEFDEADDPSE